MPFLAVAASILLAAGTLVVRTGVLETEQGTVACALYDSAEGFPGKKPLRAERLPVRDGGAVWRIEDLEPGDYAVSCYHDRDDNGELDKNVLGIPTEPYGFSNDARGTMGPPKFKKARFRHDGGETTLEIRLH